MGSSLKQRMFVVVLLSFSVNGRADTFLDSSTHGDLVKAGETLANSIANHLQEVAPAGQFEKYTVAVLPFGNSENKYDLSLGDNGTILQATISDAIRSKLASSSAAGKFLIHFPFQIQDTFRTKIQQGISPAGLNAANVATARQVLAAEGYQVGVVGSFGLKALPATGQVQITATLVTPTDSKQFTASVKGQSLNSNSPSPNPGNSDDPNENFDPSKPGTTGLRRIAAAISVKTNASLPDHDDDAWTRLNLYEITEPYLLEQYLVKVPIQYKGKRYRIEVRNNGFPKIATVLKNGKRCEIQNPDDEDRIFATAVMVDGISAFWSERKLPNGQNAYVPDTRNHAKQPKRILTGIGREIKKSQNGDDRIENGVLQDAPTDSSGNRGYGHSKISLVGFQKDFDFADAFVFANAQDSPGAEFIGSINEIGLISIYAYAEKLPGDVEEIVDNTMVARSIGTGAGPKVPSPLFAIKVKNGFYSVPAAAIHIIYRYEDCQELPEHDPDPVTDFEVTEDDFSE